MIKVLLLVIIALVVIFVVVRLTRETPAQKSARLLREKQAEIELAAEQQALWERQARNRDWP